VLVVELKNLIECFLGDLRYALVVAPPLQSSLQVSSPSNTLHIVQDDERGTQKLIFGCPIEVYSSQLGLQFVPLCCDLLQFIIVTF